MDGANGLGTDSQAPTVTIPLSHADQDLFTKNVSDALDTQESTPITPSSGPVGQDPFLQLDQDEEDEGGIKDVGRCAHVRNGPPLRQFAHRPTG